MTTQSFQQTTQQQLIQKFGEIFCFLTKNMLFNHAFQERVYFSIITPNTRNEEKVISLLYHFANTQPEPKMDRLAKFYKKVYGKYKHLSSFSKFLKLMGGKNSSATPFFSLYQAMRNQEGWGPKTAALFTKAIYYLHSGFYPAQLRIWDDAPTKIDDDDKIYLPVDEVIINIFKKLDDSQNWDFDSINMELEKHYKGSDIAIWDDLWFWGFITQKVKEGKREFEWNEAKYWSKRETDKNNISLVEKKAKQFLEILLK